MSDFASPNTNAIQTAIKALTCKSCGAFPMRPGKALAQTYTPGEPDFAGDKHASTFSAGGPGDMIDCFKRQKCGWSVT